MCKNKILTTAILRRPYPIPLPGYRNPMPAYLAATPLAASAFVLPSSVLKLKVQSVKL
jgi:hypothetical protein